MRFEVPSGDLAALLSSVRRVSDDVRSAREDKGEDGFLCNQMTLRPGGGQNILPGDTLKCPRNADLSPQSAAGFTPSLVL